MMCCFTSVVLQHNGCVRRHFGRHIANLCFIGSDQHLSLVVITVSVSKSTRLTRQNLRITVHMHRGSISDSRHSFQEKEHTERSRDITPQ